MLQNDYAIFGAEDGTVCEYGVAEGHENHLKEIIVRTTLAVRDIALSPDEKWVAVCSDEIVVKVVNRHDIEQIYTLQTQRKPVKHVSYDPSSRWLAASCTDGKIYLYNVSGKEPSFSRAVDSIIPRLETSADASSKCYWHPAGRVFACATATREVVVVDAASGEIKKRYPALHNSPISSIAWSPNGRLIASAALEGTLVVFDAYTGMVLQQHKYEKISNVEWHNHGENLLCWSNLEGEVYIVPRFLKSEAHSQMLSLPRVEFERLAPPNINGHATNETNGDRPLVNGRSRAEAAGFLDDYLAEDGDAWIEDDDGAGYTNENGKRPSAHLGDIDVLPGKRARQEWRPIIHEAFQPGATPWIAKRKYLCLNLTGFVWTIDQSTHHTVTVEFYDQETQKNFHFTDLFKYDKACLNEHGALFAAPADKSQDQPAMIFYRPHETWTNRADFRISLPDGEEVVCIALSSRYIIACTTQNYVRVYTLFGTPLRIWRMKSSPAVTCAAFSDYLITISNGSVNSDGTTQLIYSIDNIRDDEAHQNSDLVALGTPHPDSDEYDNESVNLKTLFWTDTGDPAIYDSTGTLLILLHWRQMGQAKWVPVLDTRLLDRLKDGRKEETYWPVAVADEKFHCIILKGGDQYPYFPRPLLSEFDLSIPIARPITSPDEDDMDGELSNAQQVQRSEESFVRVNLFTQLLDDYVQSRGDSVGHATRSELAKREIEVDKILVQLLAAECREGEDRGMKALEIVKLMRDRSGKMIEAASKVAGRFGRNLLEEKIRDVGEKRALGLLDDS